MSTLRVANLQSTAGTQTVTQDRLYRGAATAWVNFNGTGTVAIRDSYNVSSITDNGVGDYTVNFTTALANANYSITLAPNMTDGAATSGFFSFRNNTVSSVRLTLLNSAGNFVDHFQVCAAIHGGY